jgi:FdrA protein
MIVRSAVRRSAYYDSVALMQAQQALRRSPGIVEAGVVMGTEANLDLLRQAGLDPGGLVATADDLVVAVRGDTEAHVEAALASVDGLLRARPEGGGDAAYRPRTIAAAARMLGGANLALISVPGRFATGVAREALRAGLNVMLFSDNVPVEDEVELKHSAHTRGLLCMGPDCGTAAIAGAALGFANRVRRGRIGLVGAAGTGLQEVMSIVHRLGDGVSHALGAGGRDLTAHVGGAAVFQELTLLGQDAQTAVVVLVSKPPDPAVAGRLAERAAAIGKPVVLALVGASAGPRSESLYPVSTLEEAALVAVELAGAAPRSLGDDARAWIERATERAETAEQRLAPSQRYLRGLYSGGTLCAEAIGLLQPVLGQLHGNVRMDGVQALASPGRSEAHTLLDLGADEFTAGRLHPMLDMTLRVQRLAQEGDDPTVAVILLDVVLGEGVHPYPAGALAAAISHARAAAASAGRDLVVVASVCGTDEDPQNRAHQVAQLEAVGVLVEETNARAAALAGAIVAGRAGRERLWARLQYPARQYQRDRAPRTADASGGDPTPLLSAGPRVVNVGLAHFAESLRGQHVPVVDLDWRPPAECDRTMLELLDKLE